MNLSYKKFEPRDKNVFLGEGAATLAIPATKSKSVAKLATRSSLESLKQLKTVATVATVARASSENTKNLLQLNFDESELIQILGVPRFLPIEDWIEFEERAAILEFDGGHSREEAERLALVELDLATNGDEI